MYNRGITLGCTPARRTRPDVRGLSLGVRTRHTDKEIGLVDGQGVALAAIQGLNAKLEARLAEQEGEIAQLKAAIATLLAKGKGH